MQLKNYSFNWEDVGQVCVGAFSLAVPVSFSEEAWQLGETLPWMNIIMLFLLSIAFLSIFTFQSVFQGNILKRQDVFLFRIIIAYLLTFLVVALVLFALNKLPLLTEPILSLKRIMVISMPASMGAIIVDSFDKE